MKIVIAANNDKSLKTNVKTQLDNFLRRQQQMNTNKRKTKSKKNIIPNQTYLVPSSVSVRILNSVTSKAIPRQQRERNIESFFVFSQREKHRNISTVKSQIKQSQLQHILRKVKETIICPQNTVFLSFH